MDQACETLLLEFARGCELIFDNAELLHKEACLLREHGSLSRALALHQLSCEECGKLEILCGETASLVMGHDVRVDALEKKFRSHKSKNYANAYHSVASDDERAARDRGDRSASVAAFKKQQAELHRGLNENKNRALYVDFTNGTFSAPKDCVTANIVAEMRALNEYLLGVVCPYVRLARRVANDPSGFGKLMTTFSGRIKQLSQETPNDPVAVFNAVMGEVTDSAREVFGRAFARESDTATEDSREEQEPGTGAQ